MRPADSEPESCVCQRDHAAGPAQTRAHVTELRVQQAPGPSSFRPRGKRLGRQYQSYLRSCYAFYVENAVRTKALSRGHCCVGKGVPKEEFCRRCLGPHKVLGFLTQPRRALRGAGIRRCPRLLWNQLWGVGLRAADPEVLACCERRGMCLWPPGVRWERNMCDVLSCCLRRVSNCPPSGAGGRTRSTAGLCC